MKKQFQIGILSLAISAGISNSILGEKSTDLIQDTKAKQQEILDQPQISDIEKFINTQLQKYNFNEKAQKAIKEIVLSQDFQEQFFNFLKKEKAWGEISIILAIIFSLIYFFGYYHTEMAVRKEYKEIVPLSFILFGTGSLGSIAINGIVPGSFVYTISSFMASWIVFLNYKNKKEGKIPTNPIFGDFINENPLPVVHYNKNGKPLQWNSQMEKETGYTFDEILKYYEKYGEVMALLYKGENLKKVQQYLIQIEKTGKGYRNVAFTLNTKSGEEKTFLWTTIPDGYGGTIRTAKHLTNIIEIQKELENTKQLLRTDSLTGVLNRRAFNEDFLNILNFKLSSGDSKKYGVVFVDIDNFKKINDSYGHEIGDKILIDFSQLILKNIRNNRGDKFYRIGGDEFVIVFSFFEEEKIISNLDQIRKKINTLIFGVNKGQKQIDGIGISLGYTEFDVLKSQSQEGTNKEKINQIKQKADEYMYGVKYLFLIKDILIQKGYKETQIPHKNAIAHPKYDENGEVLGINITSDRGLIFITREELEILKTKTKKYLNENEARKN